MTHAAITACLNKLSQLIECYRAIESLPTEWLDNLDIQHVLKASDHAAPRSNAVAAIYAGTVFQVRFSTALLYIHIQLFTALQLF